MLVEKECEFCHKIFMADTKELNRGNAKFCSISCSMKNRHAKGLFRKFKHCKCVVCGKEFESINPKAKYCCKKCKSKYYRQLICTAKGATRKWQQILNTLPCANCGWNLGPRDVHHIIPACEGGKNELNNLITLCPNCHRLAHRNLLSKDKLQEFVDLRTISSSCSNAA